jgi:hypothetical protein
MTSTTNISFNKSLKEYKAVYFHFLDGLINEKVGDYIYNIKNFIINNNIVLDKINILEIEYTPKSFQKKLIFTNLQTNLQTNRQTELSLNFDSLNSVLDTTNLEYLKQLFSYCIYQNAHDDHAISFLVFIKHDKMYLLVINSGAGIANNNKHTNINSKIMYVPYYGICICDNINSGDNLKKSIIKVLNIFQLHHLYLLIKHPYKLIYSETNSIDNNRIDNKFINLSLIRTILVNLITAFDFNTDSTLLDFNQFEISIHLNISNEDIRLYNFNMLSLLGSTDLEKISLIKNSTIKIVVTYNFYDLIIKIFNEINRLNQKSVFNLSDINITKQELTQYGEQLVPNTTDPKIPKIIIDKLILHNNTTDTTDVNLYINSQESGSCSWFSIYWPIVLYNIFINDQSTKYNLYIDQIKHINSKCYNIIQTIFTRDNFDLEYKYDTQSTDFEHMKKLCNKFVDIGIVNKDILLTEVDFIFNTTFDFKFKKVDIFNSGLITEVQLNIKSNEYLDVIKSSQYITTGETSETGKTNKTITPKLIFDIIDSINKTNISNNNIMQATLIKDCYDLFLFAKNNEINIFSQNKINPITTMSMSSTTIVISIIEYLNTYINNLPILDEEQLNSKKIIITMINEHDITKYHNYF